MIWVVLSILTAGFESAKDVLGKQALRRADSFLVAWAWRLFALPFLLPLLLLIEAPSLGPAFWRALVADGVLNVISSILYMQALKDSELSIAVPMISFTPLFLLLTSPLLLGEVPSAVGCSGVVLIVAGSYLMKAGERKRGLLAPFSSLLNDRGPRLMLLVALIWSVTANIDKIGVQNSSPLFWAAAVNTFIALVMTPLMILRWRRTGGLGGKVGLVALGGVGGLTAICQMLAISMTQVPYVIAIKRTSVGLAVLWGHFLFGEKGLRERLTGAMTMLAGVLLIILS